MVHANVANGQTWNVPVLTMKLVGKDDEGLKEPQ